MAADAQRPPGAGAHLHSRAMSELPIRPYERQPAAFHPWDPQTRGRRARRRPAGRVRAARDERPARRQLVGAGDAGQERRRPRRRGDARRHPGHRRRAALARVPAPGRPRPVPADAAPGPGQRRPRRDVVPGPSPRHAAGPSRAGRAARLPRRAAGGPATLRDGYAASKREFVEAAPDGDANLLYTVYKGDFVQDALYRLGIRRPPADAPEPLAPGATIGILGGGQLGPDARDRGPRDGLPDRRPRPRPGLPDRRGRGRDRRRRVRRSGRRPAAGRGCRTSSPTSWSTSGWTRPPRPAEIAPLRPGLASLRATRDRLAERRFIREIGEWAAPWREVRDVDDARAAADALGYPVRLKTPIGGYDGRSQVRVTAAGGGRGGRAGARWLRRTAPCSGGGDRLRGRAVGRRAPETATVGRSASRSRATSTTRGSSSRASRRPRSTRSSPPTPARSPTASSAASTSSACSRSSCSSCRGGGLMINELAPRVHNSGHWTIEGAVTSPVRAAPAGDPAGCRSARSDRYGAGGDGQPPRDGRGPSGPPRRPRPGARATRPSTSTSTASDASSSGARWAT